MMEKRRGVGWNCQNGTWVEWLDGTGRRQEAAASRLMAGFRIFVTLRQRIVSMISEFVVG